MNYLGEYVIKMWFKRINSNIRINKKLKKIIKNAAKTDYINVYNMSSNQYYSWIYDGNDWINSNRIIYDIEKAKKEILDEAKEELYRMNPENINRAKENK
jgi:hypothetical protein